MSEALQHSLPQVPFYSIEYPGYVLSTSVSLVVNNLGGQSKLDNVFRRATSKPESLLELSLRPNSPFSHQIPGEVIPTNNIVFKIVKRRRKNRNEGEYTVEAIGVTHKTVRFRNMVDFQYQPNLKDRISQLRLAMEDMSLDPVLFSDSLTQHRVATPETIEDQSDLRLFPPPIFSRQTIPQGYNLKTNSSSILSITVNEETGEEKKRLINRMRWRGFGPATVMFNDSYVPEKPLHVVGQEKDNIDKKILNRLYELFKKRPIWTRTSLLSQFSNAEAREIMNSKLFLPLVCYVFQDGPWRDTLVRFGYDPRINPAARFYQRLYFRNANHPIARPSVTTRRQERTTVLPRMHGYGHGVDNESERSQAHIFDGKNLTKETAAFQLCDIDDPMLKGMIDDANNVREECNERDGWYITHAYERIKMVLRHKFFSLLEGHVAPDEECRHLLAINEGSMKISSTRSQRLRAGKHNMAKGALRPEDAAAMRLRAALDRNAKSQYTMRSS
ncbi:hypothetical protein AX15_004720 [Amanita polypyramis BW_CC]|nr:hypothetical protein AX15_004720 [Amanita polypyramis BW_CC]